MNYQRIHDAIIIKALLRTLNQEQISDKYGNLITYFENHHIVPKSFEYGRKIKVKYDSFKKYQWNKAILTAREHYIIHKILIKIYSYKTNTTNNNERLKRYLSHRGKMIDGWKRLTDNKDISKIIITSHDYELMKVLQRNHQKNTKWYNNGIKNIKCLPELCPAGFVEGRIQRKYKWYNNGIDTKSFKEGTQPEGWILGNLYNIRSGERWYNNGIDTKSFKEGTQPEGWILGNLYSKGENNSMYGVHRYRKDHPMFGRKHTDETKTKQRLIKLGKKGHPCSELNKIKVKERMSNTKWYTNGITAKQFKIGQQPEGWILGTLKRICIHCALEGSGANMTKYHFDNCKFYLEKL
jgi:hypothetical protein